MNRVMVWLRRIARGWSLLSIAFVMIFVVGEILRPTGPRPTPIEWLGLTFFPGGVMLGLAVAWRWEQWGGIITLTSLALFYLWDLWRSGDFPGGPFFVLLAFPGLLFLVSSFLSERVRPAT